VDLGKGENHFTFNPDLTAITNHSDVNLNVVGHNGNDFVNLSFGDILESRVNVNASNLGGSTGGTSPNYGSDLGHLAPPPTTCCSTTAPTSATSPPPPAPPPRRATSGPRRST
jgi:hypothetical protein